MRYFVETSVDGGPAVCVLRRPDEYPGQDGEQWIPATNSWVASPYLTVAQAKESGWREISATELPQAMADVQAYDEERAAASA